MAQEQLKIVKSEPLPPDWVEAAQGAREGAGQPETFFGMGIDPRLTQAISGAVESEKARTACPSPAPPTVSASPRVSSRSPSNGCTVSALSRMKKA